MTALLSIRDLTVTYRRDSSEVAALNHVSLDVT
ncbi:MAG: ABC transporter ATP-binding protein, partial [Mesorhizobium sp.]